MSGSHAQERNGRPDAAAKRRRGDSPVYIAMALVTAAVGVGMFLQLGLAGWLSVVAALSLFLTMFSLHNLGLRSAEIAELRAELSRLETEMRRVPPRPSAAAMAAHHAAAAAPPIGQTTRSPRVEAAMRHAPMAEPMRGEPMRGERLAPPLAATSAPATIPAAEAPLSAPAQPAFAQPTFAQPSLTHPSAVLPATGPASAQASAMPAHQPGAEAGSNRDPWSFRENNSPDVAAIHPAAQLPAAEPNIAQPAAPSGVRDADVEVIQGLIKKLADEVNGQDAQQQPGQPRHASATPTEAAIETSLEALRTTAMTMRERDEAAGGVNRRPQTLPEPTAVDVGQPTADAPQAPARSQQASPPPAAPARNTAPAAPTTTAAATVLPPAVEPPAVEPEIDTGEAWLEADAAMNGEEQRISALREAITAQSTEVYLEPILTLIDQRPRHYEVQIRPRTADGVVHADDAKLHAQLGGSGLLALLDRTRIARVSLIARRLAERGRDSSIFSGFSAESLIDDEFLNDFANAFHERGSFSGQLVLTFSLADVRAVTPRERLALEDMRDLGFRFAIDHVTDLDVDFEDLRRNGFQFIKLDANVFLEGLPASGGLIPAADICRHLAEVGMTLIVGHIEDEAKFARAFGFGVLFGQGQMFGGPRLVKTEPAQRRTAAA